MRAGSSIEGFRVSGFGFRVSSFGFRGSGLGEPEVGAIGAADERQSQVLGQDFTQMLGVLTNLRGLMASGLGFVTS
jgi:hypothetical protein